MDPDKYQQAWQAHSTQTRVVVDADMLLREVQRNQRDFRATIFRRDFLEIAIALLLLPYWFYAGITFSLPWTWYLSVPVLVWMPAFMLVYRMRHGQKPGQPDEPLLQCVQRSLAEVEAQIWLLRNVLWWYLLPPGISIAAFFAHIALLRSKDWMDALGHAGSLVFLVALYWFVYWLNQRAVRTQLEPRRQELLALLAGLEEESAGEQAPTGGATSLESSRTTWRWVLVAGLCLVTAAVITLASGVFDSPPYEQPARSQGPAGDWLAKSITEQRAKRNLVGLAAMVMIDGQVEAAAADGERKRGSGVPLEVGDRWHLGGITKSITATMIARLVESGKMRWTETIGEAFPEASVHAEWKPVTLTQLLTDTAGAPANFPGEIMRKRPSPGPERTLARRDAALAVLSEKPAHPPGGKFEYSNVGYVIVAAMAEKAAGVTWEDLVKREVFAPLELAQSGFGPPESKDDTLEQPRGHRTVLLGKTPVDDQADNTPIMGPSGSVHMTLSDLCKYATEHLRGELGTGRLLAGETWKRLHAPELAGYACGWVMIPPIQEDPHTTYWHNGSNTMWFALVVFIPDMKMVVAVTSNDGDIQQAESAAWEIVKASVKQFDVAGNKQLELDEGGTGSTP